MVGHASNLGPPHHHHPPFQPWRQSRVVHVLEHIDSGRKEAGHREWDGHTRRHHHHHSTREEGEDREGKGLGELKASQVEL